MSVAFLCRTCGKRIDRLNAKDLFSNELTLQKIHALTGLWLTDVLNMPVKICAYCLLDLEHAFNFRERCIKTNEILMLQNQKETNSKFQTLSHSLDDKPVDSDNDDPLESDSNAVTIDDENVEDGSENEYSFTDTLPYIVVPAKNNKYDSQKTNQKRQSSIPTSNIQISRQSQVFYCDECDRNFENLIKLNRHLKIQHLNEMTEEYDLTDMSDFTVDDYEETSTILPSVPKQARGSQSRKKEITSSGKRKKIYFCDQCGRKFNDKANLNRHLQRHLGVKKFECDECGYKDYSQHLINLHNRIQHMGEKPYACKYCDNRFANSMTRLRHQRSHKEYSEHHIKPPEFSCSMCDKTFSKKCSLERHAVVHTGEQSFCCQICNVCFNRKSTLKAHFRSKAHQNRAAINLDDEIDINLY